MSVTIVELTDESEEETFDYTIIGPGYYGWFGFVVLECPACLMRYKIFPDDEGLYTKPKDKRCGHCLKENRPKFPLRKRLRFLRQFSL